MPNYEASSTGQSMYDLFYLKSGVYIELDGKSDNLFSFFRQWLQFFWSGNMTPGTDPTMAAVNASVVGSIPAPYHTIAAFTTKQHCHCVVLSKSKIFFFDNTGSVIFVLFRQPVLSKKYFIFG
jgi:hypothetical protein